MDDSSLPHQLDRSQTTITPTSLLQGSALPPEIKGWNWGAFLMGPIWSIGNKVWIGLLHILILILVTVIGRGIISTFLNIATLTLAVTLGIKGNEWAWKAKKWDNVEHFKRIQKKWAIAGVIIFIFTFIIMGVLGGILVGALK